MKCVAESTLRAFVDHELPRSENERVVEHLKSCSKCEQAIAAMANDTGLVKSWMSALSGPQDRDEVDSQLAYAHFEAIAADRKPERSRRLPMWLKIPQLSAVSAVIALILLLSLTPMRSWAQHFLQMLRVQKVAVIPVDSALLAQGRDRGLSQLISDSVVVTLKPGDPVPVPNAAAAAVKVGFPVETLATLGSPQEIAVQDEGAFHMTVDTDKIRAVLEEAGRSDIQVPDSVNGATIAVHVHKGVRIEYGSCSDKNNGVKDSAENACVSFRQVPSPIVSVPPGLNMPALAEAALQLAGLSAADASNFAHTVDWSSTLVIPVPQDRASYRTVPVDGVNGTLIEMRAGGRGVSGGATLVWMKNGIMRSIMSEGSGGSARILAAVADLGS